MAARINRLTGVQSNNNEVEFNESVEYESVESRISAHLAPSCFRNSLVARLPGSTDHQTLSYTRLACCVVESTPPHTPFKLRRAPPDASAPPTNQRQSGTAFTFCRVEAKRGAFGEVSVEFWSTP